MKSLVALFVLLVSSVSWAETETKIRLKIRNVYTEQYSVQNSAMPNLVTKFEIVGGGEGDVQRLEYADVIVSWDPTKFEFVSHEPVNDSRISQTLSGLSPTNVSNGINDTFADGNAMFRIHKNPQWTGSSAFTLISLNGTWLTNNLGNLFYKIKLKNITPFVGQTTELQILPSLQIPGYDTAYTAVYGGISNNNITGSLLNSTVNGHTDPNSKLNLIFEAPEVSVSVGEIISVPVKMAAQTNVQRFSTADVGFVWNPSHLRLLGVDWSNNNPYIWDTQSGFPESTNTGTNICCDFYGVNETIPPQDGSGLMFVYGQLGAVILINQPELLGTLRFEVVGSFTTTEVKSVDLVQGTSGAENTSIYGSYVAGLDVVGQHITAIIYGNSIQGDFNGDGSVGPTDLSMLMSNWGAIGATENPYDLSGDGVVNATDLAILFGNWN